MLTHVYNHPYNVRGPESTCGRGPSPVFTKLEWVPHPNFLRQKRYKSAASPEQKDIENYLPD